MKTLVTHMNPDLDACMSTWMVKRFMSGWKHAQLQFVPAGKTLNNKPPDDDPDIIHTDTGLGRFDHHQTNAHTCAAARVFEYLHEHGYIKEDFAKPLERMAQFATEIDHFADCYYPEAQADRYGFLLPACIDGLYGALGGDNQKIIEHTHTSLDGIFQTFRNKVRGEEELETNGYTFESYVGKSLAIESKNDEVSRIAQKDGYVLVIRRDPNKHHIRIKTPPSTTYNLTPVYERLIKADPKATWFLHASKNMLLNGSSKNPDAVPSSLTIAQVIKIVKEISNVV